MSFLAPLWLALGAAAAIPIVLHLLRLRRGERVEFPAIRYLLRAEREHRRELRLRNLALMVLRVAIVAALAMAAARPIGPLGGSGHAPTALAIVLDNSMSTGAARAGGVALESLRNAGKSVLDAATPADRVWVLTLDGRVTAGDANAARDAIARAEPMGGAGDLVGTIERAASMTRASAFGSAAVVVLTDGQASEWSRAARVGDVPVTIVSLTDAPPRNRAVRDARATPARWAPRGTLEVAVTSTDSADVRIALDDKTLARTTLGPDGTISVRGAADKRGWLVGRVELAPDELRGDDVRHFAVFAGDAPAVRVDASAGPFARGAVETLADGGRLELGGTIAIVSAEAASKKPMFAFAPADPVKIGAANRALAAAGVPWKFGDLVRDEGGVHGGDLDGVHVHKRYPLIATGAGSTDTIAAAGGTPWIVAGDGFLLVGSPLSPDATDLPVSARFLPWVESVIARYLLTDGGRVIETTPLADVSVPLGVDEIAAPGQPSIPVHGRTVQAPVRDGVYWMQRGGAIAGALVVNPEPSESQLAPIDRASIAGRITGTRARVLAPTDGVAKAAFATSARRPLVGTLLVLLAILILVESLVSREPRSSERSPA
ncbi:MAG TPA: VWA domain-containing protein [Gemmatimonadaceae bacterium]|nr:VWA domain-containing protein [Gemmatimonadaceae bacterium]